MSKRWGTPTWYFLHKKEKKIDSNHYKKLSNSVTKLFVDIFSNLPCPYCKDHSLQYIKKNNIYGVKTKEEMKMYLFNFHNSVNRRLNNRVQSIDILELYKRMNIYKVYNYFIEQFFYSNPLSKHFYGWRQSSLKNKLVDFLNNNKSKMTL